MKRFILANIRFYRRWISPVFPGSCRFYPTCSAYAMVAVERHGAFIGAVMAIKRILKCHPWHPGGYDPVPPAAATEYEGLRTQGEEVRKNPASDSGPFNFASEPRTLRPAPSKH